MELRLQPKPEVKFPPADKGIVSRKEFFVKKKFEEINQNFFPAHFIRNWKPKAELIYPPAANEAEIEYECDFNRNVQNCFVEDYAEEVYLRTPPPCFVVIGKCGKSVEELSQKIAEEYGSVLIQVDDIVTKVLKEQTETSKLVERILRLGVSLTFNFILALLSYVAHTAEARHRGYVLSGLPSLPLAQDLPPDQQFNYLFTWENKPTVFIHVLFDDEDLIKERINSFYELETVENKKSIKVHVEEDFEEDEDETEEFDELLPVKEETIYERDIDVLPSRPRVHLPRNEESRVWTELELFDNIIRPSIELINVRVDPQYFITVDSRVKDEFKLVQARLSLLQIWKAPIAVPFIPLSQDEAATVKDTYNVSNEEEEKIMSVSEYDLNINKYDFNIQQIINESPQTAFLTLFNVKTISPKYRWELSHYNYICPVSLRDGKSVEGKSEFAVIFMKYIYFLSNKESVEKFIKNPRAYVLPIRPVPLCRFIILGYPVSGKTSLAKALASEFSIPLIDVNKILRNDSEQKKNIYQEFCKQKAEGREIIRLTSLNWEDWRIEEEKRINLIEGWILYIQNLLKQRIEQFYSAEVDNESVKETQVQVHSSGESMEGSQEEPQDSKMNENPSASHPLELRGISIDVATSNPTTSQRFLNANLTSPSAKIIHAMKHEDFDFHAKSLEIEANLFFSSLWKSFSRQDRDSDFQDELLIEENYEIINYEESMLEENKSEESVPIDWCSLLPPQSLSSLLINKTPNTTREKRESFKIFLDAASKAYWVPSALKSEFAKWRLPCFFDIPLCEIFLKNPILLLKYVPEWLKERPLIPNPIDSKHPSVLEAGREAYLRASVVVIKQNQEEIGILLRGEIEKAEREGMRVTGEVITPGGWVVDNMPLDLTIWNKLACENVFADHVFMLIDTEPDYRRIINLWWDLYGQFMSTNENVSKSQETLMTEEKNEEQNYEQETKYFSDVSDSQKSEKRGPIAQLLIDSVEAIIQGERELDKIYEELTNSDAKYKPITCDDVFCREFLQINAEALLTFNDDLNQEDVLLPIQTLTSIFSLTAHNFDFFSHEYDYEIPLGVKLQFFTQAIVDFYKKKTAEPENEISTNESLTNGLEFFLSLLTVPSKLEQIKDWMTSIGREATVHEIEMTGKTCDEVFSEIRGNLMKPFIKKPRELESFEMEEIKKFNVRKSPEIQGNEKETEVEDLEPEPKVEEEDVRIFGESGPLCVVNLERDIYLQGNPEFALRYYGKLYYFWNQETKDKFIENPEKFAPYYSAIRDYPPLRIFIVGPVGCGKTKLAKSLADHFSVPLVDYSKFITRNLVPHASVLSRKYTAITNQKLLISEKHNLAAKIAKENFVNSPKEKRQFWLESPLYLNLLQEENFHTRMINLTKPIILKSFPEIACIKVSSNENLSSENSSLSKNLPETPYVSMQEINTIISNYTENYSDLPDYCTNKSLKILWTEEPYITHGFVLEGFPLRFSDVARIIGNNWVPDLIIEISLPEDEVVERNTNLLMEEWDTRLKQEIVEERLIEDTLFGMQNLYITLRRNELLKMKREEAKQEMVFEAGEEEEVKMDTLGNERFLEQNLKLDVEMDYSTSSRSLLNKPEIQNTNDSDNSFSLPEETEEQIKNDVEKTLKEEFPSMVFDSVFETYDAGKSRVIGNLLQMYKRDANELDNIRGALKEEDVSWLEIDGLKNQKEILNDLFLRLDEVKKRSTVRGEFSFEMTMEMAEKLLHQGFYFLSKFGRWCPVQMYQQKNPIHMFRPFSIKKKITPIAYRNYIYFIAGKNEKIKFMKDPIKYTFAEPQFPNIPIRIAIIGPPKSGKSILSKRLGAMFDLKVVTMGSALRFVLEKAPHSTLVKSINSYLRRGCFLPLSLKVEALMVCLNDPSCVTQGFIFDGVPFDAALTQSLAEKRKLPFVIISLVADSSFGKANRQNLDLKEFRLPYKNKSNLDSRYRDWQKTYRRFAQWNQNSYSNLYEVNAKLSVVDIFYQAYEIIRNSTLGIFYYVQYCVSNRVLPLRYLCVSQQEYELRKSSFLNNCPVCWSKLGKLSSCSNPPPRSGLVQFLDLFYWICPKHMEEFAQNPKIHFPPHASKCPKFLPERLDKNSLKKNLVRLKIHGLGRCPVTRIDFPDNLDWEGSYDFAASYKNEIFLFKNEKMLERFLSQPWRYCQADTRFEINCKIKSYAVEHLGPPKMTSLPPIGFLEQTVSNLIHECLQVLGVVRPVYPNMNPAVTGCIFVALYLKVHNKKNQYAHLARQYLNIMNQNCKAHIFLISPLKPFEDRHELPLDDFQSNEKLESDSSSEESMFSLRSSRAALKRKSSEPLWLDLEFKIEKNIWSARNFDYRFFEMKLSSDDELLEIPEIPKIHAVLVYQKHDLRSSPIPPISNCLTIIYSSKKNLRIPDKFNYNTLYQSVSILSSQVSPVITFSPCKQFALTLYEEKRPSFPSKYNINESQICFSNTSSEDFKEKTDLEISNKSRSERFIPRFQLLSKIDVPETPQVPSAIEKEPLFFNPYQDYTYILLLSEFFHTTHVLRCYEWDEIRYHFEFSNRLDKNLGVSNVKIDYFFQPRQTDSMKSYTSMKSYQRIFDAATTFAYRSEVSELSDTESDQTIDEKSSLINFLQMCILEKLDEIFKRVSSSSFSYDSYEMDVIPSSQEEAPAIIIQEILPYPPLPWDITSRPYYSYKTCQTTFKSLPIDDFAHERHVSLLDGIQEATNEFRFISFPFGDTLQVGQTNESQTDQLRICGTKPFYFVYDFFNLPWTSFLTCPFSSVSYLDLTNCVVDAN